MMEEEVDTRQEVARKYRAALAKIKAEGRTHELRDVLDAKSLKALKAEKEGVLDLTLKVRSLKMAGRDVRRGNINVVRLLSDVLRTTLGPRGMDKLVKDSFGFVTLSNDGKTLLEEMHPQHPMGDIVYRLAKAQDANVGDGTTTVIILLGELLKAAEKLLTQKVHPTTIIDGYKRAMDETLRTYEDLARRVDPEDDALLQRVIATSISGRITDREAEKISGLILEAGKAVMEADGDGYSLDEKDIYLEVKKGGSIGESKVFPGVAIFRKVDHPNMPSRIDDARIAVLEFPLEMVHGDTMGKVVVQRAGDIERFLGEERALMDEYVQLLLDAGANVVISKRGISEYVVQRLVRKGVIAISNTLKFDVERLARATGAMVLYAISDLNEGYLGRAEVVEEKEVWKGLKMTFFDGCKNGKLVTILIRGGTDRTVDEVERTVKDGVSVLKKVLREGLMIPGGGAPEAEAAMRLRRLARGIEGRTQLAVEAFADALEVVPKTLAENAGKNPLDAILELRKHHHEGKKTYGIDGISGEAKEMFSEGIVDTLGVRTHALKLACENATSLLRIDDIIQVKKIAKVASGDKKDSMVEL